MSLRANRGGIGMPRGMPRTKRTAKPQRDQHDILAKMRAGEINPEVKEFGDGTAVSITEGHRTIVVSKATFDRFMSPRYRDTNILIRSYETISVDD